MSELVFPCDDGDMTVGDVSICDVPICDDLIPQGDNERSERGVAAGETLRDGDRELLREGTTYL